MALTSHTLFEAGAVTMALNRVFWVVVERFKWLPEDKELCQVRLQIRNSAQ